MVVLPETPGPLFGAALHASLRKSLLESPPPLKPAQAPLSTNLTIQKTLVEISCEMPTGMGTLLKTRRKTVVNITFDTLSSINFDNLILYREHTPVLIYSLYMHNFILISINSKRIQTAKSIISINYSQYKLSISIIKK